MFLIHRQHTAFKAHFYALFPFFTEQKYLVKRAD